MSSLLVLLPVAASLRALGFRAMLNLLAPDAMYYAGIANNFARYGFPTSDGLTVTNGFQPLWGWALMLLVRFARIPHDHQLELLFGLSVVGVVCAYGVVAVVLQRRLGLLSGAVATLALFPGLYPSLFEPASRYAGEGGLLYALNPWSAINGVESPFVLLSWSLLLLTLSGRWRKHETSAAPLRLPELFGPGARWCLAAILLCRLEQGLLLVAVAGASLLLPAASRRERLAGLVTVLWPAGLAGLLYVAFNLATVGAALPVSGLSKVGQGLAGNLHALRQVLRGTLGATWWLAAARLYPLLFGVIAGAAVLAGSRHAMARQRQRLGVLLAMGGLFLLLDAGFLFTFEPIYSIGYWYFWPITLIPGVLFALWLGVWSAAGRSRQLACLAACASVLLFRLPDEIYMLNSTDVAPLFAISDQARVSAQLWAARREIRADILRRDPGARLVEPFDGVFGFMLDLPARSYTGLISSPSELARRRRVGFWRSAIEDGFDLVPDFGYVAIAGAEAATGIVIVERFRPPGSPVQFYRVKVR